MVASGSALPGSGRLRGGRSASACRGTDVRQAAHEDGARGRAGVQVPGGSLAEIAGTALAGDQGDRGGGACLRGLCRPGQGGRDRRSFGLRRGARRAPAPGHRAWSCRPGQRGPTRRSRRWPRPVRPPPVGACYRRHDRPRSRTPGFPRAMRARPYRAPLAPPTRPSRRRPAGREHGADVVRGDGTGLEIGRDRGKTPVEVDAVVAVADRGVEFREPGPALVDHGRGMPEPRLGDRPGCRRRFRGGGTGSHLSPWAAWASCRRAPPPPRRRQGRLRLTTRRPRGPRPRRRGPRSPGPGRVRRDRARRARHPAARDALPRSSSTRTPSPAAAASARRSAPATSRPLVPSRPPPRPPAPTTGTDGAACATMAARPRTRSSLCATSTRPTMLTLRPTGAVASRRRSCPPRVGPGGGPGGGAGPYTTLAHDQPYRR